MVKPIVKTEEEVVDKPVIAEGDFDYAKDSKKSMRQIAQEMAEPKVEEKEEEEKKPEEVIDNKIDKPIVKEEVKPEINADEIAEKAATKATEKLKEELDAIKASNKTDKEKEEAVDKLESSWKKEKRNPKDYDEIYESAAQAGFEKAKKWFEDQETAKQEVLKTQTDAQKAKIAQQEADQKLEMQKVNDQVLADTEKLIVAGHIPRPKDLADDKDPDTIAYKDFFTKAINFNQERITKGEEPVKSIIEYYLLYHPKDSKPAKKEVAGADAPVMASKSATAPTTKEEGYIYAKDHNRSFKDIIADAKRALRG